VTKARIWRQYMPGSVYYNGRDYVWMFSGFGYYCYAHTFDKLLVGIRELLKENA